METLNNPWLANYMEDNNLKSDIKYGLQRKKLTSDLTTY